MKRGLLSRTHGRRTSRRNDFSSVWIIGRAPDGRWLMEIDEDVVAFTRAGVEVVTSPAALFDTPYDDEKMEMLQAVPDEVD